MDVIWRSAPAAALRVWFDEPALRWATNEAATAWVRAQGKGDDLWPVLAGMAQAQRRAGSTSFLADAVAGLWCRCVDLPDGLLVWLDTAAAGLGESLDERTRLLAGSIGVGFWSRDLDSGATVWDEQMYRLHHRDPQAGPPTLEQWLAEHVHPLDRAWMAERQSHAHATLEPMTEVTFRSPRREGDGDGEPRWIQAWTRRQLRDGRRLTFGMHLDVTERRLIDTLAREKERAEQAGREQTAFMARMSHELRTPLNAVLGFTRLLTEDPDERPTSRQAERLHRVREAGTRLLAMIDGVLEIATRPTFAEPVEPAPPPGSPSRPAWLGRGAPLLQPDLFEVAPPAAAPAQPVRVVCVEDNDVNMLLVRELLALRPEVELHGAADGLSGIELALRVKPDVLLLDLQLPDISGQEVMRRLRGQAGLGHCSWVALSANAMSDHIRQTLALGFDAYWTKPIDFGHFLSGIDTLVSQHRMRVTTP
jgi:CheY-like chemotaxis protein/PAS domain-containing protein